jgi:hypothetical protein
MIKLELDFYENQKTGQSCEIPTVHGHRHECPVLTLLPTLLIQIRKQEIGVSM